MQLALPKALGPERCCAIAFIPGDSGAALLLLESAGRWKALSPHRERFATLRRVLCLNREDTAAPADAPGLTHVDDWLAGRGRYRCGGHERPCGLDRPQPPAARAVEAAWAPS